VSCDVLPRLCAQYSGEIRIADHFLCDQVCFTPLQLSVSLKSFILLSHPPPHLCPLALINIVVASMSLVSYASQCMLPYTIKIEFLTALCDPLTKCAQSCVPGVAFIQAACSCVCSVHILKHIKTRSYPSAFHVICHRAAFMCKHLGRLCAECD
jgi:hypothetical protein